MASMKNKCYDVLELVIYATDIWERMIPLQTVRKNNS